MNSNKKIKQFTQNKQDDDPISIMGLAQLDVPETKEVKEEFTHEQLHEALMYAQDIMERASVPFIVIGDVASQIYNTDLPNLCGSVIEVAVLKKYMTRYSVSTLRSLLPGFKVEDDVAVFEKDGVPINLYVYPNDTKFLQNPDRRFYYVSDVLLPNPFSQYLKEGL